MEEADIRECAEKIKEYCAEHSGKCDGCIFYREFSVLSARDGLCVLRDTDPEDWKL